MRLLLALVLLGLVNCNLLDQESNNESTEINWQVELGYAKKYGLIGQVNEVVEKVSYSAQFMPESASLYAFKAAFYPSGMIKSFQLRSNEIYQYLYDVHGNLESVSLLDSNGIVVDKGQISFDSDSIITNKWSFKKRNIYS